MNVGLTIIRNGGGRLQDTNLALFLEVRQLPCDVLCKCQSSRNIRNARPAYKQTTKYLARLPDLVRRTASALCIKAKCRSAIDKARSRHLGAFIVQDKATSIRQSRLLHDCYSHLLSMKLWKRHWLRCCNTHLSTTCSVGYVQLRDQYVQSTPLSRTHPVLYNFGVLARKVSTGSPMASTGLGSPFSARRRLFTRVFCTNYHRLGCSL